MELPIQEGNGMLPARVYSLEELKSKLNCATSPIKNLVFPGFPEIDKIKKSLSSGSSSSQTAVQVNIILNKLTKENLSDMKNELKKIQLASFNDGETLVNSFIDSMMINVSGIDLIIQLIDEIAVYKLPAHSTEDKVKSIGILFLEKCMDRFKTRCVLPNFDLLYEKHCDEDYEGITIIENVSKTVINIISKLYVGHKIITKTLPGRANSIIPMKRIGYNDGGVHNFYTFLKDEFIRSITIYEQTSENDSVKRNKYEEIIIPWYVTMIYTLLNECSAVYSKKGGTSVANITENPKGVAAMREFFGLMDVYGNYFSGFIKHRMTMMKDHIEKNSKTAYREIFEDV